MFHLIQREFKVVYNDSDMKQGKMHWTWVRKIKQPE